MTSLAILTRDLRIVDNPILAADAPDVVPAFVADPDVERRHHSPNRQAHLAEALSDLDRSLRSRGSSLVYRRGPWIETVLAIAHEAGADRIHLARDVTAFATQRAASLSNASAVPVVTHDTITVVPPDAISTGSGTPYRVFTPFYANWRSQRWRAPVDAPEAFDHHDITSDQLPSPDSLGTSPIRAVGGEAFARRAFGAWTARITEYETTRDRVSDEAGTSKMSAALHFGTVSPLEVALTAREAGASAFLRQIAWRDFNHQLIFHRPRAAWEDYRAGDVAWNDDAEGLAAWKEGMTGYPLVDAAMRQLMETGWIHNRARMVAASFLTKDLMLDWRLGARWFMDWLVDGDIANNQMGWQWVAGTGTDTNPARMFNPTLQSQRHDPDGVYIRRWVAELSEVSAPEIHAPDPLTRAATGYPLPIVDHREAVHRYRARRFS